MNWNNFEFHNPEFLWLLILIPLTAVWFFFMRKKETAVLTVSDFDYENGTSADTGTADESGTITSFNIKASF